MTTGTGAATAPGSAGSFASDWEKVRADGDIQFGPVKAPEPSPPPDWLVDLQKWLADLLRPVSEALGDVFGMIAQAVGVSAQAIMWIAIGLVALLVLYLLWRVLAPLADRRRGQPAAEDTGWTPDARAALALLEDADRLAAEGRFDEATHLLLKRSVGQIAEARPDLLEPSSTAREIAALPALSQAARGAFAIIAERVERSLFALRALSAEDWHAARAAYAEFALAAPHAAPAAA